MKQPVKCACSSPLAMCYWFLVSLVAWGALSLIGLVWHPLHAQSAQTIIVAMSIGCSANWAKNRTLHCLLTAPLFLFIGVLLLGAELRAVDLDLGLVWTIFATGTGLAFLAEWRCSRKNSSGSDGKPSET